MIRISTKGMTREEWLKLRKTGIGGSDAGAICGLNPYSSPVKIYQDKTQEATEEEDNESMRQGRDLEDYVARRFMEETGLKVRRSGQMYRSEEYPFMLANVDRLIIGQDAGLECKTASAFSADKWKDGKIPPHYLIQCLHYMAVTGKRTWYLAVVILGREFKYHKITWNEEVIRKLIAVEQVFWTQHVQPQIMPEPDGSKACSEVLAKHYHTAKKGSEIRLVGFDEKLKRREELVEQIAELTKEQTQIDQEIKLYLKDNEMAVSDQYRVIWKNVDSPRMDTKRIKKEQPELYRKFMKSSHYRQFQIYAA